MAYGSELYLGLVGEQVTLDTVKSLGLQWAARDGLSEDKSLQDKLRRAQREALKEMGMNVVSAKDVTRSDGRPADDGYFYVVGLDNKVRQTCIWDLEVHYDPRECGHKPEDMLIGVSLISRYFPVFLDWDKESGGSGETISLTPDVLKNIEIARKHLAPVLPFIATAPIVFRERYY